MASPRKFSEGETRVPQAVLEHPTFMPRLTWRRHGSIPIEDARLPETITRAGSDTAFFADTSVISDDLDPAIFEALLATPGALVLTPFVMAESRDWLRRHLEHPLAAALRAPRALPVQEHSPPREGTPGRNAYDYYVSMLLLRRAAIAIAIQHFRREHGRDPGDGERDALRDRIHREVGPRGFLLAQKGLGKRATDEVLVYLAAEHALTTGRATIILTCDADVEEQFFKLMWLIDTHYRAMLLADRYAADPVSFKPRSFPERFLGHPHCPFDRAGSVLIARGDGDLMHVLPPRPQCVEVGLWRLGRYSTQLTFMAETEMKRVLDVKDRTGGLSTDRLGGRNLHPWLGMLPLPRPDALRAGVVRDKRLPIAGTNASIAAYDVHHAVFSVETHKTLAVGRRAPTVIHSRAGTPVVHGNLWLPAERPQKSAPRRAA